MTDKQATLIEAIQDITIVAWPLLYGGNNRYDLDSRFVLDLIRGWGEEFEQWWNTQDPEQKDYICEVEEFATRKCKEYLKRRADSTPDDDKSVAVAVTQHLINMLNNNVIEGAGTEPFQGWCEDGDIFDEDGREACTAFMLEIAPIVDQLSCKIGEKMTKA